VAAAAATMTTEPVVAARLAFVGDTVQLAVPRRRTAQSAAARPGLGTTTVLLVAWLIDGGTLVLCTTQQRHHFLQLTHEIIVVLSASVLSYKKAVLSQR